MNPLPLLPIRAATIEFSFTAPTRLRFFHQPLVSALVRGLMAGALADEPRLWINAPESGRVPFARGDRYHFQVFCAKGAEVLLDRLLDRLRRLPAGLPASAEGLPLGTNLRFRSAVDFFTGEHFGGVEDLFAYDEAALAREVGFYREEAPRLLRLLSPARLLRAKPARTGRKGEGRFVHDRGELTGELFGQRLSDALSALLTAADAPTSPRSALGLNVLHDDIGWYDGAYYDVGGSEKPMGGIIGTLLLELTDPSALPALVLGQYLGVGQRRTFGWGRYRLERADGKGTLAPRRPSRTLLSRAADPANLELAYRTIKANAAGRRGRRALSDIEPDDDITALAWVEHPGPVDAMLDRIGITLRDGSYAPEVLRGFILRREGKAPRPLAVPPFADRVAQRALMQVLQTDCEPLLSAANYGYRRGLSREHARDRLQSLYRQGYEWLYEADIDDFFDSVSHLHLEARLRSLLPDEPAVDLLLAWIAAPVEYLGRHIERGAGLPQGAPVSPLLANLMLDDFDADLEHLGFKLVRFADDFVVACRSRKEAEAAAQRVRASLDEIDLRLNEDKTRITRFDDGFRFLGYTFLGDLAVDGAKRAKPDRSGLLRFEDLPPASWLARMAKQDPEILTNAPRIIPAEPDPASETQGRVIAPPGCDEACHLLVVTEGSLLSTTNGRLRVAMADGQVHEQPWTSLAAVLVFGRQKITTPTLTAALEADIPIHFASRGGRYQGLLAGNQPAAPGHGLWLRQQQLFAEEALGLPLAREIVAARIHNQTQVLRQRARGLPALDEPLAALKALDGRARDAKTYTELNGVEGSAASQFFRGVTLILPEDFAFKTRQRRPPPDPFNALLSLGYTLVYQRVDTVLRVAGLLPWQGFYHQGRGRHAALASDLMECFRHVVERQALSMCNRGELKPADFLVEHGSCQLDRRAFRTYLGALSGRFLAPLEDAASGERGTLHDHIWRMARALIAVLNGQENRFTGFRIK